MINIKSKYEIKDLYQGVSPFQKKAWVSNILVAIFLFLVSAACIFFFVWFLPTYNWYCLGGGVFLLIYGIGLIRYAHKRFSVNSKLNYLKETKSFLLDGVSFDLSIGQDESILKTKTSATDSFTKFNNNAVRNVYITDEIVYFDILTVGDAAFPTAKVDKENLKDIIKLFENRIVDKRKCCKKKNHKK